MAALEIDLFTDRQDYGNSQLQEECFFPLEICVYG